jgi:secondary thiamine-phosphate synthase enzyme
MRQVFENHDLETTRRGQFVDLTDDLLDLVERSGISSGMALVYSPHTTCAVVVNERESGFIEDFNDFLERLAPSEGSHYRHDDHDADAVEPANGHSHVRSALLSSSSQAIPVVDGRPMLGRYQRVFLCELDRARPRKVFLQVIGD